MIHCPYCNQMSGEIKSEDPKCISFEDSSFRIDVSRTWAGMKWSKPHGYTLLHWCPWSNKSLIKVRAKSMKELETEWENQFK